MIFTVTYKGYIKGVFFEHWNALEYINTFTKEEQKFVNIEKISDLELPNLREKINNCKRLNTKTHMCNNCARSLYDNNILVCDFKHEEVNVTDYCVHYI